MCMFALPGWAAAPNTTRLILGAPAPQTPLLASFWPQNPVRNSILNTSHKTTTHTYIYIYIYIYIFVFFWIGRSTPCQQKQNKLKTGRKHGVERTCPGEPLVFKIRVRGRLGARGVSTIPRSSGRKQTNVMKQGANYNREPNVSGLPQDTPGRV